MVQTMAARTWSVKPGPREGAGGLALYGFYTPRGGAHIRAPMAGCCGNLICRGFDALGFLSTFAAEIKP